MISSREAMRIARVQATEFLRDGIVSKTTPAYSDKELQILKAARLKLAAQLDPSWRNIVLLSSIKMEYITPPYFMDIVRSVAPIALDPAAHPKSFVNAIWSFYGPCHVNGLLESWSVPANTLVFVNPPYGRELRQWAAKMADEGERNTVVALIPARVGTSYWKEYIWPTAQAVCFWNGGDVHPSRIQFYDADTLKPAVAGATFDVAIPFWGRNYKRFQEVFSPYGEVRLLNT